MLFMYIYFYWNVVTYLYIYESPEKSIEAVLLLNYPIKHVFIMYSALPSDKAAAAYTIFQHKCCLPAVIVITYFKLLWTTEPAVNYPETCWDKTLFCGMTAHINQPLSWTVKRWGQGQGVIAFQSKLETLIGTFLRKLLIFIQILPILVN